LDQSTIAFVSGVLAVGFPGGIFAIYKLRPERDSLLITNAQGRVKLIDDINDALTEEIERQKSIVKEITEERDEVIGKLNLRIRQLEEENRGLRERYGTRFSDPSSPPLPDQDV
jgi:hypothetical protein